MSVAAARPRPFATLTVAAGIVLAACTAPTGAAPAGSADASAPAPPDATSSLASFAPTLDGYVWEPDGSADAVRDIIDGPMPAIAPAGCRGVLEAGLLVSRDDAGGAEDDVVLHLGRLAGPGQGREQSSLTIDVRISAGDGSAAVLDGLAAAAGCTAYTDTSTGADGEVIVTTTDGVRVERLAWDGIDGDVLVVHHGLSTFTVDGEEPDPERYGEPPSAEVLASLDPRAYLYAEGPYAVRLGAVDVDGDDVRDVLVRLRAGLASG